jgi:hypothetical protein
VIEIAGESSASRFVSFTREAVPVVDLSARRVVVASPTENE